MTKAEFLEMIGQHWDELQDLHKHDNLYDFEKEFERIAKEMNRQALEGLLGKVPFDYRKKKLSPPPLER